MFDANHYWHTEMCRSDFKRRLAALQPGHRQIFAIACATHAKDRIFQWLTTAHEANRDESEIRVLAAILDDFWQRYPAVLAGSTLAKCAAAAEQSIERLLGPRPDTKLRMRQAEPLLWATLQSVAMLNCDDPIEAAFDAADMAYRAVFNFCTDDPEALGTDRMREGEMRSADCIAEVKTQIGLLTRVE